MGNWFQVRCGFVTRIITRFRARVWFKTPIFVIIWLLHRECLKWITQRKSLGSSTTRNICGMLALRRFSENLVAGQEQWGKGGLSVFCIIEPLNILWVFETAIRILCTLIWRHDSKKMGIVKWENTWRYLTFYTLEELELQCQNVGRIALMTLHHSKPMWILNEDQMWSPLTSIAMC